MKRKLLALLLVLLAVSALAVPVQADLIWEPDNSFYKSHRGECSYVGRTYLVAGYDGTVTLYTAPGGMSKTTVENDIQGYVQFTWTGDGLTWGYLTVDGSQEGWVPLDDLTLVYGSQQFMEDHRGKIVTSDPVPVDFHEGVLYSYPNGTTSGNTLEEDAGYLPFDQLFTQVYTDESGLRWGYVGYYMGRCNSWICLDDPMNDSLTGGIVPSELSPAQLRGSATVEPGGSGPAALPLAAALVAGVAAVTGALVLKLKKRETK